MFRYVSATVLLTMSLMLSRALRTAEADEEGSPPKPSAQERMAKYIDLGPGVHAIKKDEAGRIVSCVVVGQSRISTVLGRAKGLELARDKANLLASAEFVKWLNGGVSVRQSADEDAVILIEGSEGADESQEASGKAVERSSKRMERVAQGLVRGLQLLHKTVDGDGKTYSVVMGWRADNAEGVKRISADLGKDEPSSGSDVAAAKDQGGKGKQTKASKKIKSSNATSEDADEYLD